MTQTMMATRRRHRRRARETSLASHPTLPAPWENHRHQRVPGWLLSARRR